MAGDKPVTVPVVPLSVIIAVWPVVVLRVIQGQRLKPRAFVTLMVPLRSCMPTPASPPSVTVSSSILAVDVERVGAGGEHVDRVVAGAGVEVGVSRSWSCHSR